MNLINNYQKLQQELNLLEEEIKKSPLEKEELLTLLQDMKETIKKSESLYYRNIMENCHHVFAKTINNEDIPHYYCLKCGCTNHHFDDFNIICHGLSNKVTGNVNYVAQSIHTNTSTRNTNTLVIDCGNISIDNIVGIIECIKLEHPKLSENQQIVLFKEFITKINNSYTRKKEHNHIN